MINSMRARMTLVFTLSIAVLLFVASVGISGYSRRFAEGHASYMLHSTEQRLRREMKERGNKFNLIDFYEEEPDISVENIAILILGPHHKILQKTPGRVPSLPLVPSDKWRIRLMRVNHLSVVVAYPWEQREEALQDQIKDLFVFSMILLLGGMIGSWMLVGKTLSPIRQLSQQAMAASTDQLKVKLTSPSEDSEMVELVGTLNDLLARISESAEMKGRFYAGASHELRTPLQALSGHLELSLTRPRTAEEYRKVIEEASLQTHRLISLIRDLLLLNQLDTSPPPPNEPVDISDLCEQTALTMKSLAEERNLHVHLDVPDNIILQAPYNHIQMLIRNLIENAVKYAKENGNVTISAVMEPPFVKITIFNECDYIGAWDEKKLFEPFYRPDASRNSKTGGNGLGLAICDAIVRINGWRLTLRQEDGGVNAQVILTHRRENQ
jgi:signal transduction histidine kinase